MTTLLDIYTDRRAECREAFHTAQGEMIWEEDDCHPANDGPVTIKALAYAWARQYHRTFHRMLERASEDVRGRALDLIPEGEGAYEQPIGAGWIASTAHPASSYGDPVYLGECDDHAPGTPHSLAEFCQCGLARVRRERGLDQVDLAEQMEVLQTTISGWETGRRTPSPENREALEKWLYRAKGT